MYDQLGLSDLRRRADVALAKATRRRWPARLCVLAAVAAVAWATITALDALDAERRRWGTTAAAVRASRAIDAGRSISADDVDTVEWPLAVIPPGALAEPPLGKTLLHPVGEGELLTAADVSPAGPLAMAPAGWRGVAFSRSSLSGLPLAPGDAVEAVVGGEVVAGGVVVAVAANDVLVALPPGAAATVAEASAGGRATLVLVAPPEETTPP